MDDTTQKNADNTPNTNMQTQSNETQPSEKQEVVHFGTDGWRAIIGEDFTNENLIRVAEASARAFLENVDALSEQEQSQLGITNTYKGVLYVGHDCRLNAHEYAQLTASVLAAFGFEVKLTNTYCPTPTLCFSVAHDVRAIGGVMLTSSHNPAEYLGVKLRMQDGGASPKEFTDKVEALLPACPTDARAQYAEVDLMTPYLDALKTRVDTDLIKSANLRVVLDPLYGAGRLYLANLLQEIGVEVDEIHNAQDPSFAGLHPEPIQPWVNEGLARVGELHYDALFINDGDADRIAAGDAQGNFVNPHRIITLLTQHLVEDKKQAGRVVSTVTASAILGRMCKELGLDLTLTPVGFKWIYAEMEKGDVLLGGEESGGIGYPTHVMERDGLLSALLLCEMMAFRKKSLAQLVDDMCERVGRMEFTREGEHISDAQMEAFRSETIPNIAPSNIAGKQVLDIDRRDGVKFSLEEDAWVMMRPSGTEPLVRIYAEAASTEDVAKLIAWAKEQL